VVANNGENVKKVGVVGFGYIGAIIGSCLAERGCHVIAVEVDARIVELANRGQTEIFEPGLSNLLAGGIASGRLVATTDFTRLQEVDVIIVTVGTPLGSDLTADLRFIRQAASSIAPQLKPGHIIVLKSTVVPGVTRDHFAKSLSAQSGLTEGRDFFLAFSPERLAEGRAIEELLSLPIIVGADNSQSIERVCDFWHNALGVLTIPVSNSVSAELVKLADNLWIDMNIALANQIAKICYAYGAEFDEVQRSANTLPKGQHHVNILQSSVGVGGSCLTKDPLFFAQLLEEHNYDSSFIRAGRAINDGMPSYAVQVIQNWLSVRGLTDAKIAVLGIAFKNDTNDLRFTPVLPLVRELTKRGYRFVMSDPYSTTGAAQAVFGPAVPFVDFEEAISRAHVLCFACGHKAYRQMDLTSLRQRVSAPCLFLDGRHSFQRDAIVTAGFDYQTI